jgi:hypothetical protein
MSRTKNAGFSHEPARWTVLPWSEQDQFIRCQTRDYACCIEARVWIGQIRATKEHPFVPNARDALRGCQDHCRGCGAFRIAFLLPSLIGPLAEGLPGRMAGIGFPRAGLLLKGSSRIAPTGREHARGTGMGEEGNATRRLLSLPVRATLPGAPNGMTASIFKDSSPFEERLLL